MTAVEQALAKLDEAIMARSDDSFVALDTIKDELARLRGEVKRLIGQAHEQAEYVLAIERQVIAHGVTIERTRQPLREFHHIGGDEPLEDVAQVAADSFHHAQHRAEAAEAVAASYRQALEQIAAKARLYGLDGDGGFGDIARAALRYVAATNIEEREEASTDAMDSLYAYYLAHGLIEPDAGAGS